MECFFQPKLKNDMAKKIQEDPLLFRLNGTSQTIFLKTNMII